MSNDKSNQEFDFALVIDGVPELTPQVENALFEAGCDDATLSIQYGHLYAEFTRPADSLESAIVSAIKNVRKANVGAAVVRVDECELVTPSEIARRIGRSRQMVFQYIRGQRGPKNFPAPECHLMEGRPLWAWCAVSQWFAENNIIRPEAACNAQVVAAINTALESIRHRRHSSKLMEEVTEGVNT